MMELSKHISTLLYSNDCVVVPGFGGFVCHPKPAWISDDRHTIFPPSRVVSFNIKITENDGLLAHRLVVEEGIGQQEAQAHIKQTVQDWKEIFKKKGRLPLEGIGVLYTDQQGNTRFEPEKGCNFKKSSIGLEPLPLKQVERKIEEKPGTELPIQKKEAVVRSISEDKVAEPAGRWRRTVQWAAALIPLFLYLGLVFNHSDLLAPEHHFSYGDLNPFAEIKCSVYKPIDHRFTVLQDKMVDSTSVLLSLEDNNYICLSWADNEPLPCTVVSLSEPDVINIQHSPDQKELTTGKYHIIGGCFSIRQNAVKLVEKLKKLGYSAHILDKRHGLDRVAVLSCSDANEAEEQLAVIRQKIQPEAWLLVK